MDDSTSGTQSITEGIEFYEKAKRIMLAAGFDLRKWVTNNEELQSYFDINENINQHEEQTNHELKFLEAELNCKLDDSKKKVLGVEWDTKADEFIFQFNDIIKGARELKATKRNILRVAASFYDPIGLISPVTAKVKILFQLLCKDKLGWDDVISDDICLIWNDILNDLEYLGCVRVERFVCMPGEYFQLHGFCDSSKQAYCAAVYFRVVDSAGVKVRLVSSKTKVAPLKELSIPRLELLACVLLSELIKSVVDALKYSFEI